MKTFLTLTLALAISSILLVLPVQAAAKADAETEEAILKFEQEWADAYVKGDAAAVERILGDDYIFVSETGNLESKADEVRSLKSGALKMTGCKLEGMKVRFHGKTAIVTGINIIKGSMNGQDISGKYRFTDVLVRKKDKWQAVSSHVSTISEKK